MIREYEVHFNNKLAEQTKEMNKKFDEQIDKVVDKIIDRLKKDRLLIQHT